MCDLYNKAQLQLFYDARRFLVEDNRRLLPGGSGVTTYITPVCCFLFKHPPSNDSRAPKATLSPHRAIFAVKMCDAT